MFEFIHMLENKKKTTKKTFGVKHVLQRKPIDKLLSKTKKKKK